MVASVLSIVPFSGRKQNGSIKLSILDFALLHNIDSGREYLMSLMMATAYTDVMLLQLLDTAVQSV